MTKCSLVGGYQGCRGAYCLLSAWQNFYRDDGCSIFFQNLSSYQTAWCKEREGHRMLLPFWKPQTSQSKETSNQSEHWQYCTAAHLFLCVYATEYWAETHCVIFCGKCASPAGKKFPIICVVWIDQQAYTLKWNRKTVVFLNSDCLHRFRSYKQ
jgi:hypothetical protein